MWGEASSNVILAKRGLWVSLNDVINCAKFRRYRANSFWVAEPRRLGVPIDFRGDLYNSQNSTLVRCDKLVNRCIYVCYMQIKHLLLTQLVT